LHKEVRFMYVRTLALVLLALSWAPARGEPFRLGTLGDSLTDPYANYTGAVNPLTGLPFWGHAGDKNWVEQLQAVHGGDISIYNVAKAGATGTDLLSQGQHTRVADQVRLGNVRHAALIVGANDVLAALNGNPTSLGSLGANINTALTTVRAAGAVAVVLGTVPNLAVTPFFQGLPPAQLAAITAVVQLANAQIEAVAAAQRLPLVDLFALSQRATSPLTLGGVTLSPSQLFAPDLFHPGTVLQGLLANSYLEAEHRAYGTNTAALRLTDQEILTLAGIPHPAGATYYDVSPFVRGVAAAPEPSTLVLAVAAAVCVGGASWRRRAGRRERATA
jgi:lysophospholipase L1-like esterase